MLFEDLSLSKSIQSHLSKAILTLLLQEQSIPIVLSGRDLMGCAQTGTGKKRHLPYQLFINYTELLVLQRKKPCIVVTPTRELAVQMDKVLIHMQNTPI
jgi:ATP-dependent RNA helicase RhlE